MRKSHVEATNCLHVHLELYKPCSDYFLVELINSKSKLNLFYVFVFIFSTKYILFLS